MQIHLNNHYNEMSDEDKRALVKMVFDGDVATGRLAASTSNRSEASRTTGTSNGHLRCTDSHRLTENSV